MTSARVDEVKDFRTDPEYVARRRQVIRENHPDRGGSDEQLIRALKELDEQWARRRSLRAQFEQSLPSFVPEHIATQAYDRAEVYVDRLQKSTEALRRRGKTIQESDIAGKVAKRAGRVAGTARKTVEEQIQKRRRRK